MRYLLSLVFTVAMVGVGWADVVCVNLHTAQVLSSPWEGALVQLEVPVHFPLSVVGEKDGFYQVLDYRGRRGWIAAGQVAQSGCAVVTRDRVNVRGGPGTSFPVVSKAKEGVAFAVLQRSKDWLQVRHESGREGWIFDELVWGAQ